MGCSGTTKAWVNPLPADSPRRLVIRGGFAVDDGRTRRLVRRVRRLGHPALRGYLQTQCDHGASVPRLAQELGVSDWTISQALTTLGIALPPRRERLARQRRRTPTSESPRRSPSLASRRCGRT